MMTIIESLARSYTDTAIKTLAGIMMEPNCPPMARVAAAKVLLDRGWGRPKEMPHSEEIAASISTDWHLLTVPSRAFQFSKRAAGEATEFSRSRVELLSVIGAARLECGKPTAEAGELIRRQLGNSFGDFFDFHLALFVR